jgi:hypothetical protein
MAALPRGNNGGSGMTSFRMLAAVAALTLSLAAPALAQTLDVRTGLWEMKSERSSSGLPEMPKMPAIPPSVLAKLPPAQRAQIENAMKARKNAVSGSHVNKVCVTKKSLAKGPDFGTVEREANCQRIKNERSARAWRIQEVCRSNGRKQTMNIRYDVVNRETVQGTIDIAMHDRGHDISMKQVVHGRWLGADCGDVKPME